MIRSVSFLISLSLLALAIFIKVLNPSFIEQMQLSVFDTYQKYKPREYIKQPVIIVDIDDESLHRFGQWPWPRNILADIVAKLNNANVASIAFDIVFAEYDRTSAKSIIPMWKKYAQIPDYLGDLPDHDQLFANEIAKGNIVTGFVLTDGDSKNILPQLKAGFSFAGDNPRAHLSNFKTSVSTISVLQEQAAGNGFLNSNPDKDGILRKIPTIFLLNDQFYPSLSSEALRVAQGASTYIIKSVGASGEESYGNSGGVVAVKNGMLEIPTDAAGNLWVYYTDYKPQRYLPVWKLLDEDFDASSLEGHIILVGTSAAGLRDIRATPLSPTSSGVEVHAQAIEQILSGQFLSRPDWMHGAEIIMMLFVGLILIIFIARLPIILGVLFTISVFAGALYFSWYSFVENGLLIDPVTSGIAVAFVYLSQSVSRFIETERQRRQVSNAFSHYMSPDMVKKLAEDPSHLKLGGETKDLTILFCDIRGFTTISEGFEAEELTNFINQFLTPMTDIIQKNKGTIDKYIGDCIMAFWNAPLDDSNHAKNACLATLQMVDSLKGFNQEQEKLAKQHNRKFIEIKIGIGLNSGECCVGNIGSDQRFDYSVLGDNVNLSSRLEGQSKNYGVDIVIGENTQIQSQEMANIELDLIRVKGKNKPVRIFCLLGDEIFAQKNEFKDLKTQFESALEAYRNKKWSEALKLIKSAKANADNLAINLDILFDLYKERIKEYKNNPPDKNWDGVFVATSK
ncbi:adenylate/guanylate cyclase domain-containing protein [Rickettsiales bacterium]|nr:adenylate/guanylate cyclase domain-containing protein [Rickettsiales bacterium]